MKRTLGFLFGSGRRDRDRRDAFRASTIVKNAISPINTYGHCFNCTDGVFTHPSGKQEACRLCGGTGWRKK
jgi:hypothetical protein